MKNHTNKRIFLEAGILIVFFCVGLMFVPKGKTSSIIISQNQNLKIVPKGSNTINSNPKGDE